jgi:hypothetical protein
MFYKNIDLKSMMNMHIIILIMRSLLSGLHKLSGHFFKKKKEKKKNEKITIVSWVSL